MTKREKQSNEESTNYSLKQSRSSVASEQKTRSKLLTNNAKIKFDTPILPKVNPNTKNEWYENEYNQFHGIPKQSMHEYDNIKVNFTPIKKYNSHSDFKSSRNVKSELRIVQNYSSRKSNRYDEESDSSLPKKLLNPKLTKLIHRSVQFGTSDINDKKLPNLRNFNLYDYLQTKRDESQYLSDWASNYQSRHSSVLHSKSISLSEKHSNIDENEFQPYQAPMYQSVTKHPHKFKYTKCSSRPNIEILPHPDFTSSRGDPERVEIWVNRA